MKGTGLRRQGFTLIEVLVVVAIIGLLLAILMPALGKAKQAARTVVCLTQMRNIEVAHWMYLTQNGGKFITVGLGHGGAHMDEQGAWINTLAEFYGSELIARSPVDNSPHWGPAPAGEPIDGAPADQRRRTSYGVNDFLTDVSHNGLNPYGKAPAGFTGDWPGGDGGAYDRLGRVKNPAATIHLLMMAFEGPFAGADHPHIESWVEHPNPPVKAQEQVQINAHGGNPGSWDAISNYGFLDGHAETLRFDEVFKDISWNRFDPLVAR